jgi:probable HAF family extracellular repeat protein
LAVPLGLAAQVAAGQNTPAKHHHYKLIDMGTFGGPTSGVEETAPLFTSTGDINNREMIGTSTTSIPTTGTSSGFACPGSGLVAHAFVWRMGIVTDLGTLAGSANCSGASAINAKGVIVGQAEIDEIDPLLGFNQAHAVQWEDGRMTDLGTLGGYESIATDINHRGLVVGLATNAVPDPLACFGAGARCRAALWRHGAIQDLGSLGGPEAAAILINERDQIVGVANTDSAPSLGCILARTTHPFLWENDRMTDLGTLGGTCAIPLGLNNRSQVVGIANLPGDSTSHAFLWPGAGGKIQDLGTLGGSFSDAYVINDAGEAVGDAGDISDRAIAVVWKNGVMINLGLLNGDCASSARSVNSKGQIVGYSSTPCDFMGVRRAVLWEDGSMVDLNTLIRPGSGMRVALAETINDRGEIAADGAPSGCEIVENCGHAVLLIPCDNNHPDIDGCDYSMVDAAT